jgi:hypothetical protein
VERCDGAATTEELVEDFCSEHCANERAYLPRIYGALDRLYRARVIVFGEQKAGWGWLGGPR